MLFRSWNLIRMPYTPDSKAVTQLLGKIDAMLSQLGSISKYAARIGQIRSALDGLKTNQAGQPIARLPMKDGTVNAAEWEGKPEIDRQQVWAILAETHDELRCLNGAVLTWGKWCFGTISALLFLTALFYLYIHRADTQTSLFTPLKPKQTIDILKETHLIELQLAAIKSTPNKNPVTPPSQSTPAKQPQDSTKTVPSPEPARASQPQPDNKPTPGQFDLKRDFTTLTDKLSSIPLSYETIRLLGIASAELEADDITIHPTYQQFLIHLRADLETLSTTYFWTIHPWRWVELALWATIGCLVGLLFYIASQLKQGIFQPEEIPMFGAELLMAPIVVPVVFFLFAMTNITTFTPSESSITVNIGVAFILGFAIRRTIGLIDVIKKRLLPDPAP